MRVGGVDLVGSGTGYTMRRRGTERTISVLYRVVYDLQQAVANG